MSLGTVELRDHSVGVESHQSLYESQNSELLGVASQVQILSRINCHLNSIVEDPLNNKEGYILMCL